MDTRAARRAAEKAARDLISNRAALVGELGVVQAERARLEADVTDAADQGRQLVANAETEAAQLLDATRGLALGGEQRYADAYSAATAAGWAATDLTALGFPPADNTPRRRRATLVDQPEPMA